MRLINTGYPACTNQTAVVVVVTKQQTIYQNTRNLQNLILAPVYTQTFHFPLKHKSPTNSTGTNKHKMHPAIEKHFLLGFGWSEDVGKHSDP